MIVCVVGGRRLEVLHKVNNLVKEWIRDISIKKVSSRSCIDGFLYVITYIKTSYFSAH